MLRKAHRRRGTFLWTVILTATSGLATGAESGRAAAHDVDAAARRLAGRILGLDGTRQRLPLASDVDHARTIDPVMTEGTAIWIHEALPSPPLTVLGGRVFSYSDVTYDPLDAPVLKIRPVDDQQGEQSVIRLHRGTPGIVLLRAVETVDTGAVGEEE